MQFNEHSTIHRWFAKWLIHLKLVKQVVYDLNLANQAIEPELPVSFDIRIPSGEGELAIADVTLSIDKNNDVIVADVLCHFKVSVAGKLIYDTYIQLLLEGLVHYQPEVTTLRPDSVKLRSMKLISDGRSRIKDTRNLIIDLLPEPLKTIFISTVVSSDAILKSIGINELIKYLIIYLGGSKQRVLDYHHADIETTLLDYIASGALDYQMDESIFEEQLFAVYGRDVLINDGELLFRFN